MSAFDKLGTAKDPFTGQHFCGQARVDLTWHSQDVLPAPPSLASLQAKRAYLSSNLSIYLYKCIFAVFRSFDTGSYRKHAQILRGISTLLQDIPSTHWNVSWTGPHWAYWLSQRALSSPAVASKWGCHQIPGCMGYAGNDHKDVTTWSHWSAQPSCAKAWSVLRILQRASRAPGSCCTT